MRECCSARGLKLLPIWLAGVWLYHYHQRAAWPRGAARAVWGISLAGLVLLLVSGLYAAPNHALHLMIGDNARRLLRYSQFFPGDISSLPSLFST